MNAHLTQQIATQRQNDMRHEAARRAGHRQARQAYRMRQASQAAASRRASFRPAPAS